MAYARTTLTVLRARLLERVGGQGEFWVTAELDYAINEALAVWQMLTGDFVTSESILIEGDLPAQDLTATSLWPFRVKLESTILTPTTPKDVDQGRYGWRNEASGTAEFWLTRGGRTILLVPVDGTGGTLSIEEYDGSEQLTAAGDYVQLGDEDINAILDYAQSYLAFKEGPGEGTDLADGIAQMFVNAGKRRASWLARENPFRRYQGTNQQAGESSEPVAKPGVKNG